MAHSLKILPPNNIEHYRNMDLQCTKCGSVFLINVGVKMANFLLDCDLEQGLRKDDPERAKELPILVKED